ncbi:MAG TPA: DUF481 domain-containing protein [Candidatus Koribacter sp.]|jgi:putative salt-induced outer membrane protein YdiY
MEFGRVLKIIAAEWRESKSVRYSLRMFCSKKFFLLLSPFFLAITAFAADTPKPGDTVTFVNGEQMSGSLIKVADGKVFFHSDMVGDVSFDWSKVKELHTAKPYAVIAKGVRLHKHGGQQAPEGTLEVTDNKIAVASTSVPTADAAYVVDQASFDKQIQHSPSWSQGWLGAVTAGVSLVEATQNSETFTSGIALARQSPSVDWLRTNSRTLIDFTSSYGKITQPGTPTVKTNIFHADGEQDEYLTDRFYALGHAAFDHNFSQGLDLQQLYGGGLGYTIIKNKVSELDVKGDLHYEKQTFDLASSNQNLFGSEFAETYMRKLPRNMVFTQGLLFDPAWNVIHAYSAQGMLGLAAPISKKFSLSINLLDGYLNNPPPTFKKNSFQFTTGLTYAIK